jgi:hypothetical protein
MTYYHESNKADDDTEQEADGVSKQLEHAPISVMSSVDVSRTGEIQTA